MGSKRTASAAAHKLPKSNAKHSKRQKLENNEATNRDERPLKKGGRLSTVNFLPRPDWYATELPEIPLRGDNYVFTSDSQLLLKRLHEYANKLLDEDSAAYETIQSKSSSKSFLSTFMSSGTLEDRISALTLLVQESPLHNRKAFGSLLALGKKKSRNQALIALSALKDLLAQGLVLPANRKLRPFVKQPALLNAVSGIKQFKNWTPDDELPGKLQRIHLIYWAYEDWLKRAYLELLRALETWSNDEIGFARSRALTFVWELLKEKPEQEENLLRLLINKLGDKDKKISSRASYLLLQLQGQHPLMKGIIVDAIESDLLFRPGQSLHAKYYAVITMNQTVLSAKETTVANKLLDIYFKLFAFLLAEPSRRDKVGLGTREGPADGQGIHRKNTKTRGKQVANVEKRDTELNEKLLSQLLTGVNRAFPFAQTDDATFESKMDTLFRTVHSSNFNTSVQALMLIQQVSSVKQFSADRFYRTLYESILDPRLLSSSKQILYLNLLYRSLKSDLSVRRVKAFIKRLLQVVTLHEPPFACAIIYLVGELQKVFPSIKFMIEQAERNDESDEEHFIDVAVDGKAEVHHIKQNMKLKRQAMHREFKYNGRKRDPEHSNAEASCLWEIMPFQSHFHPSVSLFARRLLLQAAMPPKPDPTLHTLIHFLDRFTYKNAKSLSNASRGSSIMQPSASTNAQDILIRNRSEGLTEMPLNTESFWSKPSDKVDADQVFFHQYFNRTTRKKSKKTQKRAASDDDSGEDEQEIWDALVQSNVELQDDHGDDEDLNLEDLGSEDNGSDDSDMPDWEQSQAEDAVGDDYDFKDNSDIDIPLLEDDEDLLSRGELPRQSGHDETAKSRKRSRKDIKSLPTFAAADDYADLLAEEEEEH